MKIISDQGLIRDYIVKNNIDKIFDDDVLQYARLHFYQENEFIFRAESELKYYYLLVDGKIKISFLFENGKSMLLKFYQEFNSIGDLELLKNIPIQNNVEAIEDTYLIAIPSTILRQTCLDNVKFLNHLVESLSDKLYATINNISYNYIYPLINRLSSYLVAHMTGKDYIILNLSYEETAAFLGTTYRHLNRTLKELETNSIIRCANKKIYILDKEKLQKLSKNLYL